MAEYLPLLELEIEEPHRFGSPPQRIGFTDRSEDVSISPGDGSALRVFGPGLMSMSPPGRRASFFDGTSSSGSASATLALDALPVVDLRRRGVRIQRIRCRMWWWPRGGTLTDAVRLWRGEARDPKIDLGAGTVGFSFKAATRERDVAFPPGFVGDSGRFTDVPAASRKQPMQVVYGRPREVPLYALTDDSGAFAVRLLVAGHPIPVQSITVQTDAAAVVGTYARGVATDGRGTQYSYIDVPAVDWPASGASVYAASVTGYEEPAGVVVEGLGDVLLHMVHTYGGEPFFELDRPRIYTARVPLNRFTVGCYFNAPDPSVSILSILKQRFEGQFPVVFGFVNGLFGWDYVGVPPRGRSPVAHVVYGQNASSRGILGETDIEEVRARYEILYRQLAYAAGEDSVCRVDETNSAACQGALARWGVETVQRLQAPDVVDAAGAYLVAEDEVRRRTDVRWTISYGGLPPEWMALPIFSRVYVTDPGPPDRAGRPMLNWSDEPFLITGVTPSRNGTVTVELIGENGY